MKALFIITLSVILTSCATNGQHKHKEDIDAHTYFNVAQNNPPDCVGEVITPPGLKPVANEKLIKESLGEPGKGGLCEAQAYEVVDADVTVFRLWNSTNPGSNMGNWWALNAPTGSVSKYRRDYVICYQWTPLDRLSKCKLKKGAQVVIGTGQSAECSQYLSYDASPTNQLYISKDQTSVDSQVESCEDTSILFDWKQLSSN